jgi:aminopeptidase N
MLARWVAALGAAVMLAACTSSADIADDGTPTAGPAAATAPTKPRPTEPEPTGTPPTRPSETPPPDNSAPGPDGERIVPDEAALEAGRSEPVEDPYYPETSNPEIDVLHYFLDLDWDGATLKGQATLTFRLTRSTDSARLDLADNLAVHGVALDGARIDHAQADDGLQLETGALDVGSTHTMTIDYSGSPEPTEAPSMRADMTEGLGWLLDEEGNVYTFQEPYGAFTWYPVNDHPSDEALYDARITTYDGDIAVFNGERVGFDTQGGVATSVWHLDEPMASYLATIAIGPYEEHVDETPSGFPISYWLLSRDAWTLDTLVADGDAAFPWLEEHAGAYPFSTLGVVVVAGTSGMETQTMVTLSAGAVGRGDAVLLHEFAHMWYGDSVSPVDWQGMWLNEGWATYMQQWFERESGMQVVGGGMSAWRIIDSASRLVAGPPGDYDPAWFGDSNVYLGPAMMLDRIRQRVGDETFEELVAAWPAEHENANVDRETFTTWINDKTGQNLTPLIDRWLDSPITPR